jgi:hypothetical protein
LDVEKDVKTVELLADKMDDCLAQMLAVLWVVLMDD